jgi:hypothetical protein
MRKSNHSFSPLVNLVNERENFMKVTDEDRAKGWKEIRIAMLDGKLAIVRVSAPTPGKMVELMTQKMSHRVVFEFVSTVLARDANFVLKIDPRSFQEIFVTASCLLGAENLVRKAMKEVGQKLQKEAEA